MNVKTRIVGLLGKPPINMDGSDLILDVRSEEQKRRDSENLRNQLDQFAEDVKRDRRWIIDYWKKKAESAEERANEPREAARRVNNDIIKCAKNRLRSYHAGRLPRDEAIERTLEDVRRKYEKDRKKTWIKKHLHPLWRDLEEMKHR